MPWQAELEALIEETMAQVKAVEGTNGKPVVPPKIVERVFAESPHPARLEPMVRASAGSERAEIKRRVASFKVVHGCSGNARTIATRRWQMPASLRRTKKAAERSGSGIIKSAIQETD